MRERDREREKKEARTEIVKGLESLLSLFSLSLRENYPRSPRFCWSS